MQRIAVAAHKGGSGKTTVSVNLAGALAAQGAKVLVVDADPQGAAGIALGASTGKPSLYEALIEEVSVREAIWPTENPGIDILPGDLDLAGAEVQLPELPDWQTTLRDRLRVLNHYDVAVIDTAPGLGVLPYLALSAADRVLIVCPPEYLSFRALPTVLEAAQRARVPLIGIVPNRVEGRTRHEADVIELLREHHAQELLTAIPRRVVLQDAAIAGKAVSFYAPDSPAAEAFGKLAKEVTYATTPTS